MDGNRDNNAATLKGEQEEDGKLCRDFMRNVCNRGMACRFIHPVDIKIKTDPIFCHDYQQSKCFRSTCKFIHCSREEEEHYKTTGELPDGYIPEEQYRTAVAARGMGGRGKLVRGVGHPMAAGMGMMRVRGAPRGSVPTRGAWIENEDPDIPVCKDFLKGVCDRPPGGCKFRHAVEPTPVYRGGGVGIVGRGGGAGPIPRRRLGGPGYYDEGPEPKRTYDGYGSGRLGVPEYEDYYGNEYTNPPPPPPPQQPYPLPATPGRSDGFNAAGKPRRGF